MKPRTKRAHFNIEMDNLMSTVKCNTLYLTPISKDGSRTLHGLENPVVSLRLLEESGIAIGRKQENDKKGGLYKLTSDRDKATDASMYPDYAVEFEGGIAADSTQMRETEGRIKLLSILAYLHMAGDSKMAPGRKGLESWFLNPPVAAKPYVWWHRVGSNFSKYGIAGDLEAIKATRIGEATIFNLTSAVRESHAPAGEWMVCRIGHATTGRKPHPVPDDMLGKVPEADKISEKQRTPYWKNVTGPAKQMTLAATPAAAPAKPNPGTVPSIQTANDLYTEFLPSK